MKTIVIDDYEKLDDTLNQVVEMTKKIALESNVKNASTKVYIVGNKTIKAFESNYKYQGHPIKIGYLEPYRRVDFGSKETVKDIEIFDAINIEVYYDAITKIKMIGTECYYNTFQIIKAYGYWLYVSKLYKCTNHTLSWLDSCYRDYKYLPKNWDKENPEPRKFNVVSAKNVRNWITWLNKKDADIIKYKEAREIELKSFRKRLNTILGKKHFEVVDNNYSGSIYSNGLKFTWELEDNGKLNTKISLNSFNNTFEAFVKMACGNYDGII